MHDIVALTFLILEIIFDHIVGSVFAFRRGMSNAICDIVLNLKSEGLNILWMYIVAQFHSCTQK